MIEKYQKVAVIGAGAMGNGIAHVFAQSGYEVQLIDVSQEALEKGLSIISKNLDRMIKKEKITDEDKKDTLGRISLSTKLVEAVKDRNIIVEAATENLELKLKIFKDLDKHAPFDAVLASNTSSISITQIAAVTVRSSHVIGMHFMNPVPIMKLVEVISGYDTFPEITNDIIRLSKDLGKNACSCQGLSRICCKPNSNAHDQ